MKPGSRLLYVLFVICVFLPEHTFSQFDTLETPHAQTSLTKEEYHAEDIFFLKNKAFPYINTPEDNFLSSFFYAKNIDRYYDKKKQTFVFDEWMGFNHCTRYGSKYQGEFFRYPLTTHYHFKEYAVITGMNIPDDDRFNIRNAYFERGLDLEFNTFKETVIDSCPGKLNIRNNTIGEDVYINGRNQKQGIVIEHNTFTSYSSNIRIKESTVNDISIAMNKFKHQSIEFINDTIASGFYLGNIYLDEHHAFEYAHSGFLELTFYDCYINTNIANDYYADTMHVAFSNCTFGPKASFVALRADKVRFINCYKLPSTLELVLSPNKDTVSLEIVKTSFEDISFLYTDEIRLAFLIDESKDFAYSTYEGLLAKFKKEGRSESFQRLDIQYANFKAGRGGSWDKFVNCLDRLWWNYGYSKGYIIGWTFLFLVIFFLCNCFLWKKMQTVYPIGLNSRIGNRYAEPLKYHLRKYAIIFLYTAFIFFSLKVDFDKISFKGLRLVAFFFLQYMVGLTCLFFIANAILKI